MLKAISYEQRSQDHPFRCMSLKTPRPYKMADSPQGSSITNRLTEPVEVLVNSGSGREDKTEASRRLEALFRESNIDARIHLVDGEKIPEICEQMARGSSRVVVAAGGDGTINALASAI